MNPVTTVAVAAVSSGVLGFSTIAIPVKATDVVKVFVLGVSSDTGANVFTEVWDDCLPNLAPGAGGVPLADTNGKVSVNNLPADYLSAAEQTALTAASTGTWASGLLTLAQLNAKIPNNLSVDTNGKVAVNNLPADYLSTAEQTALTAASTGSWASGLLTQAHFDTTIPHALSVDTNGKVSVNNLPADYLSAAEQTALTAASTGTWASGLLTLAQLNAKIPNNLSVDTNGKVAVNNLPADYLSTAEQTALTAASTGSWASGLLTQRISTRLSRIRSRWTRMERSRSITFRPITSAPPSRRPSPQPPPAHGPRAC